MSEKKDAATKEYMRNPIVFADVFNQYLHHGKQIVRPEALKELDTVEIAVPYGEGEAGVPEQRYRDVLKVMMTDGDTAYCILGIENQSDVHYAMPVRNMLYDSLQLAHQVVEAAKSNRKRGCRPSGAEYLSGFYRTDKLLPVITLVVFYSAETWDGPLTLKEMYSVCDEKVIQYAPDYKVNLIAPGRMTEEEIGQFHTSLREVMLYIKYSKDKEKLREMAERDKSFYALERQAVEVINAVTDSKLKYEENEESINMCQAIQEIREEGKLEGIMEGKMEGAIEMCKEFQVSLQDTIRRIAEKFDFPLERAEEEVKKYWETTP